VSNRWGGKTMVAEYKLKTHTSVPTQQEDGTTKWVDYYSSDEVNSGIKGMLSKILSK